MKIIGLTGGIGAGKSTASKYLAKNGYAVIDADQIAREVVEPGKPLLAELRQAFGAEIIKTDGSLDRKALAAIVFEDEAGRRKLNRIMHSNIIQVIDKRIEASCRQETCKGIIIDAPLLFETGLEEKCDQTWLLVADWETRIRRVCARDGAAPQEVEARIKSQMDDEEKRKRADLVIDNSGSRQELEQKLKTVIAQL
ncbi:dephospho-CoA kinase [Ihubacter massiliensis]|uniref:Dephospho-CoA kinase n=1 Tax=Hominibacterium faecale TaxID=2839743 RepID=A0A9J6QTE1_9FIRM|nr:MULTISPECIES: dephospho-CoA kinase [Eubacteriales Family XIII. Incertae Sedis]MCC2865337.1 dephospho-CoA kinase [Anaerovorax odorimutans]MCO7120939.1 dephospho-CoA kinase [Ihubacter massiliensis]MCU7377855.1 dephospho-CoA kinase [Hominibacterium faecale]MDE8732881.1 dephospho-CoA kinase [Eubacteriales bacterium DFI.9.88]